MMPQMDFIEYLCVFQGRPNSGGVDRNVRRSTNKKLTTKKIEKLKQHFYSSILTETSSSIRLLSKTNSHNDSFISFIST